MPAKKRKRPPTTVNTETSIPEELEDKPITTGGVPAYGGEYPTIVTPLPDVADPEVSEDDASLPVPVSPDQLIKAAYKFCNGKMLKEIKAMDLGVFADAVSQGKPVILLSSRPYLKVLDMTWPGPPATSATAGYVATLNDFIA